jgi:methyl-accepting chemotaxis protein
MKISNLKIGQRLAIGFGLVIVLMIAATLLGYTQLGKLNDGIELGLRGGKSGAI